MRRSRCSLLVSLGTFATLLAAVGFADGGHQSPVRPSEFYRLDLDDPIDSWSRSSSARFVDDFIGSATASQGSAEQEVQPGSEGWIAVSIAGSPIVAVLYIDDETACLLACPGTEPAVGVAGAIEASLTEDEPATAAGSPGDANGEPSAELPWIVLAELYGVEYSPTPRDIDSKGTCENADEVIDIVDGDQLALRAAAAYSGLSNQILWQFAVDRAARCEFAWDGCTGFPDGSVNGWLNQSETRTSAEVWRAVGRAAWGVVELIAIGRDNVLSAASRGLAEILRRPVSDSGHATVEPASEEEQPWPNLGRWEGSFLTL